MKARVLSYYEIEERFRDILTEIALRPLNEEAVIEKGGAMPILLRLCISQMNARNSTSYPQKSMRLKTLEKASTVITYKINTCIVEEVTTQISAAYRAFGAH